MFALTALPAMAAVSRIIPGTDITTDNTKVSAATVSDARAESGDISRTVRTASSTRVAGASRTVAARNVAASSTRAASARASGDMRGAITSGVRKTGLSSRVEAASINANPIVRRAGLTLRPSVAEVGGRAKLASGEQTGSNIGSEIRNLQPRAAQKLDTAAIATAKERMEQVSDLNRSCQEQYNDCMDQFCAVVDANQKRCSCSANLNKYTKVESAVKEANTKLNEVAQNIRYVGLSADEISAIMSATEAEEAMSGKTDTTESRNMLAEIEKMIKDPTTASSSYSGGSDSYGLLDIDMDFGASDASDIFSLDFLTNSNSSSFSNLRGTNLYNAAKKRCAPIISQCKEIGATSDQITGNYELAIDKDCIAYEQGLTKMNETLVSNVRSATRMLQKARLAVLQNQNTYDARGCVNALETCMKDDMVCGENYNKCIDPTKKYIDENGSVVLGQNINTIQDYMSEYNNASINSEFLRNAYANTTISDASCKASASTQGTTGGDGSCIVKYLLGKIGTKPKAADEGLCRAVLDKCRAYTYDTRGNYKGFNDIVVNYIQRAMVNIRAAQYKIVSDYASTCLSDIASCYNEQVSQLTSWSATAAATSVYNIMRGACRNVALTCGYAVFANDATSCPANDAATCIESISEVFYQSLLCPDNSVYQAGANTTISPNNIPGGWVNKKCKCQTGFVTFNGSCLPECENGGTYLSTGVCSAGASCPANSETVDSSLAEFWGRCRCKNNYHWIISQGRCITCPINSTEMPNQNGDFLEGWCKCDNSDANNPYFPTPTGLGCRRCPSNSTYSANGAMPCVCTDSSHTYFSDLNCCAVNRSGCYIQPGTGGTGGASNS